MTAGRRRPVTIVAFGVGPLGGMEIQLTNLITGLLGDGYPVTVIANACELPRHRLLSWHRVPAPKRPFAAKFLVFALIGSLQTALHRRGVVHTLGAIVVNRADVSTVNHCHAAVRRASPLAISSRNTPAYLVNARVSAWLSRFAERVVYRPSRSQRIAVATTGVASEVTTHYPAMRERVSVVPNGVDVERFHPDSTLRRTTRERLELGDTFAVLFLGGDWARKGLDLAIEALAMVDRAQLLVVGRGHTDEYSALAARVGVLDRVRFLGTVDQVHPVIVASDVFLLPSLYETWSLPAFEAAACGLPLVATRVHGVEEILRAGENGWFVKRDSTDIARLLRMLRDDDVLRERFGEASHRLASGFTWRHTVDGYERLYDAVRLRGGNSS